MPSFVLCVTISIQQGPLLIKSQAPVRLTAGSSKKAPRECAFFVTWTEAQNHVPNGLSALSHDSGYSGAIQIDVATQGRLSIHLQENHER